MTAADHPVPAADHPAAARPRRTRRWHRLVVPYAVLLALASVTLLAHHAEEPDLHDPGTLSPAGSGPDGSSRLAGLLDDRGVQVVHVATYRSAWRELRTGQDMVVFVPKPTAAGAALARAAADLPGERRIVVVAPDARELGIMQAPVSSGPVRWAARAALPGCRLPEALAAGRAAVLRHRYAADTPPCYAGGLVQSRLVDSELLVVGASDPFRNRRIGEHGNAALAVSLLSAHQRVVWLGAIPGGVTAADGDSGADLPPVSRPTRPERDRSAGSPFAPLVDGYPPGVLAGLALAALVAVLVALARARRLGPPVPEPLPVVVPASEAVAGRGRLYLRSRARGPALEALRAAALRRLAPLVAPRRPEPDTIVAEVAARSGSATEQVRRILYGPAPATDAELTEAVAALDRLVEAAMTHQGGQR